MSAQRSSYAILGLRPGAGRTQVDSAYRRLMKLYHPDRTGGDGSRAAEINRAYACIRRDYPAVSSRARTMPVLIPPRRRPRSFRAGWGLALVAASVAGVAHYQGSLGSRGGSSSILPVQWAAEDSVAYASSRSSLAGFDEPLHSRVIGIEISQAVALYSGGDLDSAAEYSRECHTRLRENPNLAMFDACAAFDESTLTLTLADPRSQVGPFGGPAVMTRQMAAARMLSDDMFGADSRLRQIRSRVDLALLPRLHDLRARGQPPGATVSIPH
jgi:hypothetical protein